MGAITAALAINGEPLNSATATVTPAAVENFFNIYVTSFVEVPRGCCLTVAAENTSTQTVLVCERKLCGRESELKGVNHEQKSFV